MRATLLTALLLTACGQTAAPSPCAEGDHYLDGLCYHVAHEQVPALTAARRCTALGGWVVEVPQSRDEVEWLLGITGGVSLWVGPTEDLLERAQADLPCLRLEEEGRLTEMTCWSVLEPATYPSAYACELLPPVAE